MPIGTGSVTLQSIPSDPFVMDPSAFFAMTKKNVSTPINVGSINAGEAQTRQLPQVGVKSKLRITFEGTAVVSTAAATPGARWPYGLLDDFTLSANAQTNLFQCSGGDLHVLRFIRYPAYTEQLDVFPGVVGGDGSAALTVATHQLFLTWEVPIAMDDTTLIGSLFAQSAAANLQVRLQAATNAQIISANPANVVIAGTWKVQETFFDVPFDDQNRLVVPDLTKLHGFIANTTPFTNVGEVKAPLIRSAGQLMRLLLSAQSATTNPLTTDPVVAATRKIDAIRLEYGGNQRPLVYEPGGLLLSENQNYYGGLPPYDRHVLDFVRENPPRDVVNLLGVTDLNAVLTVNAGVTVTAGLVRAVQETLF